MSHLYFRRQSDNFSICSRNWNEAEKNKTSVQEKKNNESQEYILKDLSFQILWLSSWIRICLQTEFYKKINISMVDKMLE